MGLLHRGADLRGFFRKNLFLNFFEKMFERVLTRLQAFDKTSTSSLRNINDEQDSLFEN